MVCCHYCNKKIDRADKAVVFHKNVFCNYENGREDNWWVIPDQSYLVNLDRIAFHSKCFEKVAGKNFWATKK